MGSEVQTLVNRNIFMTTGIEHQGKKRSKSSRVFSLVAHSMGCAITVDWKYNLKFIKKKFNNTDISLITNDDHQLINESLPIRAETFNLIVDYIKGNKNKISLETLD